MLVLTFLGYLLQTLKIIVSTMALGIAKLPESLLLKSLAILKHMNQI